jgi:FMN phosphatase YigB (HAD superfamily)
MIKVIIFDLDGTLYKSKGIAEKFAQAAYYTLSKFQNISLDDAQKLIEEKI